MSLRLHHALRFATAALGYFLISHGTWSFDFLINRHYYLDPAYAGVWSTLMMPVPGSPPLQFYLASKAVSLIVGVLFVFGYRWIGHAFHEDSQLAQGSLYGLFIWLFGIVPALLAMILFIRLPLGLIGSWGVEQLIILVIAGALTGRLMGKRHPLQVA